MSKSKLFKKLQALFLSIGKSLKLFYALLVKRKFLIFFLLFLISVMWLSGFFIGWLWSKGKVGEFPDINSSSKLLIVAPHPDDEDLIAGGIIQRVIAKGGSVKVIYLTIGDRSIGGIVKLENSPVLSPNHFFEEGEKRHAEAIDAMKTLGLSEKDLVFLGFPDGEMQEVLNRSENDKNGAIVSQSTKLDHVPYSWSYKIGQPYYKETLEKDLKEIFEEYKPTIVITTHSRDTHPDHKAAFEITDKLKEDTNGNWPIYGGLVHFREYPAKALYLYPPKKLFNEKWVSLELTETEKNKKKESLAKYYSQLNPMNKAWFYRFDNQNELWELE